MKISNIFVKNIFRTKRTIILSVIIVLFVRKQYLHGFHNFRLSLRITNILYLYLKCKHLLYKAGLNEMSLTVQTHTDSNLLRLLFPKVFARLVPQEAKVQGLTVLKPHQKRNFRGL